MIRVGFCIIFFSFSILVTAQNGKIQNKEGIEKNKGQDHSDSTFSLSKASKVSIYHAGAISALGLHINPRTLRSSFCLSCHDGVSAREGHTSTNVGNPKNVNPTSFLNFNHPVAFKFTKELALSKHYLNDPYTTPSGLGGTIAQDLLVEGRIECISCHNILFNPKNLKKFETLNISNVNSGLCLTCHNR